MYVYIYIVFFEFFSVIVYYKLLNIVPCGIGEGNGNPLQDSFLENSMDRGAWQATVHGVAELDVTE